MTHASSRISARRSVALNVPDLQHAEDFSAAPGILLWPTVHRVSCTCAARAKTTTCSRYIKAVNTRRSNT